MKKTFKKLMSIVLALALLMTYPATVATATLADHTSTAGDYTRVVDPSSVDDWKSYFVDGVATTENAGGIWTDKSVFLDASAFPQVSMDDENNNFLIALSAIASNKSIMGYSHIPTDTVLVLDISASMNDNQGNNDAVEELIYAANNAIKTLQGVNNHNRVSVVLYSGNTSTSNPADDDDSTVLLPLDRYTQRNNEFLSYRVTGNNNTTEYVDVNDNVYAESGPNTQVRGSVEVVGGTYIQGGIYKAAQQLLNADTVIPSGEFQAGTTRMPIIVVMSDGNPTIATNNYMGDGTGLGESNIGDGSTPGGLEDSAITFATQLTAAYVKAAIEEHYGRDSLFYTMGFKVDDAETLDPSNSSTEVAAHWTTYNNTAVGGTMQLAVGEEWVWNEDADFDGPWWDQPEEGDEDYGSYETVYTSIEKSSYDLEQFYVDAYFNDDSLSGAFREIVDEIILQSLYYPTSVENGLTENGGYIEFYDDIGEYMEVKDIKGIVLGDTLYTGELLAQNFTGGSLGTVDVPTDLGNELIWSIKERLGIASTLEARELVTKAYGEGQLGYNGLGDYGNYIRWYADANGEYMGFASLTDTEPMEGAEFLNISYGFMGDVVDGHKASDMMYVSVQIHTRISTGNTAVVFRVPASLIPVVSYNVTIEGTSLEDAQSVTLEIDDKLSYDNNNDGVFEEEIDITPIRLVYEMGLREEVNELTVADNTLVNDSYSYVDNGTYTFYTNRWDANDLDPDTHFDAANTLVYYEPSVENERYYYTEDSTIYVLDGTQYVPYTGASKPAYADDTYYRSYAVFEFDDTAEEGNARIHTHYEEITEQSLSKAEPDLKNGETAASSTEWIIPKGVIHRMYEQFNVPKGNAWTDDTKTGSVGNYTETLIYKHYSTIEYSDSNYYVNSIIGNNGKTSVVATQGIKITKEVDATLIAADNTYTFVIQDLGGVATGEYRIRSFNADGTEKPVQTGVTFSGGKLSIDLKEGESAYLIDLPAEAEFNVSEEINGDYTVLSVNGQDIDDIDITVEEYVIANAGFVNTATPPAPEVGVLVLRKLVEHPFDDNYLLNLADEDVPVFTFEITVGENAPVTKTLKPGEVTTIEDIPVGTEVTIVETNIPDGFTSDQTDNTHTFTMSTSENHIVTFTNTYSPDAVPQINVTVTGDKSFTGREDDEWLEKDAFTFRLEKLDPATQEWEVMELGGVKSEITVTGEDPTFDFSAYIQNEVYDEVGTYSYRMTEVFDENPYKGITFDQGVSWFNVIVTDADMDGALEISDVVGYQKAVVSESVVENVTWENVTTTFENVYAPAGSDAVSIVVDKLIDDKTVENQADSTVSKGGYLFGLYQNDRLVQTLPATVEGSGETLVTLTFGAGDIGANIHYVLKEIVPDEPARGIKYSEQEYTITVTVEDDTEGGVIATISALENKEGATAVSGEEVSVTFTNTYKPDDAEVTIGGNKTLKGRAIRNGEFTFELYSVDDEGAQTLEESVTNTGSIFSFKKITYSEPGTHKYVVKEKKGTERNMTYDETVYEVVVKVTDNNGVYEVTKTVNGEEGTAISFTNTYDAPDYPYFPPKTPESIPETGGDFAPWIVLSFISTFCLATEIFFRKKTKAE